MYVQLTKTLLILAVIGDVRSTGTEDDTLAVDQYQQNLVGQFNNPYQTAASRCLYLCQNDSKCKSGQCILTECSDTPDCYHYCMLCNVELKCFQFGDYCHYARSSANRAFFLNISSFFISICFQYILIN